MQYAKKLKKLHIQISFTSDETIHSCNSCIYIFFTNKKNWAPIKTVYRAFCIISYGKDTLSVQSENSDKKSLTASEINNTSDNNTSEIIIVNNDTF